MRHPPPGRTQLPRAHARVACSGAAVGLVLVAAAATAGPVAAQSPDVAGSWSARTYRLKDGPEHRVEGTIFFTDSDWSVLFFVMGPDGEAKRASAEGGTYTLAGEDLVFTHLHLFAAGEALEGLAESEMSMVVREAANAPTEPTRVQVRGGILTLFFPSGNSMRFERSS